MAHESYNFHGPEKTSCKVIHSAFVKMERITLQNAEAQAADTAVKSRRSDNGENRGSPMPDATHRGRHRSGRFVAGLVEPGNLNLNLSGVSDPGYKGPFG